MPKRHKRNPSRREGGQEETWPGKDAMGGGLVRPRMSGIDQSGLGGKFLFSFSWALYDESCDPFNDGLWTPGRVEKNTDTQTHTGAQGPRG